MTSLLLTFFVFFVLFGLAIFFWIWWVLPRGQVPPHLTEEELRRLEVQDRLRQTNYQILAALALGATFLGTVFQLTVASRQWASDYALKVAQERLGEFSEALKEIDLANVTATNRAGLRTLFALGIQDPANYHFQANDVMSAYVRQRTQTEVLTESAECRDDVFAQAVVTEGGRSYDNIPYPREEALPEVQAAMSALGHPKFAAHRERYVNGACESWTSHGADMTQLRLDHLILDDLDLARGGPILRFDVANSPPEGGSSRE